MDALANIWTEFRARAKRVERQYPFDPCSYPVYTLVCSLLATNMAYLLATDLSANQDAYLRFFVLLIWFPLIGLLARSYGLSRVATALEMISLPTIMGALIVTLTIVLASISAPFADEFLARADTALGLDWLAWFRFYQDTPWVGPASDVAYRSFSYQMMAIPIVLSLLGFHRRVWTYLTAWGIAALASAIIFAFLPAAGPYVHYGITPEQVTFMTDRWPWQFGPKIEGMQSGTTKNIMKAMGGLVTFPSFHVAAGVLFMWATWPFRLVRPIMVMLNMAMILATPIRGAHYFIDVPGGVAIALLGIWLGSLWVAPKGAPPTMVAARRPPSSRPGGPLSE